MKTKTILAGVLTVMLTVSGCKQQKKEDVKAASETEDSNELTVDTPNSIQLIKLEGSPAYSDASLMLNTPKEMEIAQVGEVDFSFDIANYELGAQTQGPNNERLANSGKGQHIHFILNNQPYSAHYEPSFKKEIPAGVHHLVAFLSRSYHESVKNENSVVVRKLMVGQNPKDSLGLDMNAPTLIYSRPKGEYAGKDTENLLLDFFVLNTTLSETGHKVKATVNGQEFTITEWAPYVVQGLPKGEVTIQLELLDANENLVPGPFNKVTRTVLLKD